jgi:ATPase family protein associated with various cellular activities (AAA)
MASAPEQDHESRAVRALREIFDSGRPLVYVRSAEEQRVGQLLREAVRRSPGEASRVWTWSLTEAMRCDDGTGEAGASAPRAALDFIVAHEKPDVFHLKDFHEPLRSSAEVRRRLRDVYEACLGQGKFVIITSPVRFIPDELERSIAYLELRPPDLIELAEFVRGENARLHAGATMDDATVFSLARALQGLTLDEARFAIRRATSGSGGLGPGAVPALLEEKRLLVNRTGVVEYVADGTDLGHVGGLEDLKQWLLERRKLFQLGDDLGADIVPKGVLVMGISGCGKSLSVKAIASYFGLPLYRIDMIEIFSGRHGSPEGAFVHACRMLEEMAPAVVWFDEIEMAVNSTVSSGDQGRIFAFFLTWMQEKARGLFVAATANRIDLLPAEMIRKGRFDEVFFVDLPVDDERAEIFKVHLARRGMDPDAFDLQRLTTFSKGWTGAEVEQCVVSALTAARLQDRELADDDLVNATTNVVPLSRTMKEQVDQIRRWAFGRAVRASRREVKS